VLRKALFPDTTQRTPLPPNLLTSENDLRHFESGVTAFETQLAITHLKYGTSVGPDNISYGSLCRFHDVAPHLLPHLFTACLRYAAHPPECKTANCVIAPKPGKKLSEIWVEVQPRLDEAAALSCVRKSSGGGGGNSPLVTRQAATGDI